MSGSMTVATYNVHGFRGPRGGRDVRRTAAVIAELDADVVAVQEVVGAGLSLGPPATEILEELPGYDCLVAPTRSAEGGFGNAVLCRHEVVRAERLDLSHRRREPRSALDVVIEVDGIEVRVVSTHLGLRHLERRRQVERLLHHLGDAPAPFLVVLGDFNDWLPGSPGVRLLESRLGSTPKVRSYPSCLPVFALDRIWVHPGSALVELWAHRTKLARRASDHLPVVARVTKPEPEVEHVVPPGHRTTDLPPVTRR